MFFMSKELCFKIFKMECLRRSDFVKFVWNKAFSFVNDDGEFVERLDGFYNVKFVFDVGHIDFFISDKEDVDEDQVLFFFE